MKESKSEVAQLCLTLCDPMDCSLPGSSIHGIFQATVLEWVAISFSRGSSQPRDQTQVFCIAGRHFTIWATWWVVVFNEMMSVKNFTHSRYLSTYGILSSESGPIPFWVVLCTIPNPFWTWAESSMEFSRQEYWSGLLFPSPGNLLDPGIKLGSPTVQADSLPSEPPEKP